MRFKGFKRRDGSVGTRNYVGIISTVVCANEVVIDIANKVKGTAYFTHQQGCCQTPVDIKRVTETLIGLGSNANLHSVLLVSLGCESVNAVEVQKQIAKTGKRVELIVIQEIGGAVRSVASGALKAQEMVREASKQERVWSPIGKIILGLKCGSSDTTSGLAPNPALGVASDIIVENGAISIFGEITEIIGAEHIMAGHAVNDRVRKEILDLVNRMENRAKSVGADIRGGQPTGGNIKGGLSTIEEKSLGAIAKTGNAKVQAVYEYGKRPDRKGLVLMDSPGREPEILTGLASAGATIIAFTTGRGAPQGFPFVPVIKITGNKNTMNKLNDHMDLDVSQIIDGEETIEEAGKRIVDEIIQVASGKLTKAEISGYTKAMDIYTIGPVI